MEEKLGIKEVLELLDALKLLSSLGGKVAKDGKVDLSDLTHLLDLVKGWDVLYKGISGVDGSLKELKDLDASEVGQVIAKGQEIVKAFMDAKA